MKTALIASLFAAAGTANASIITLEDGNAAAQFQQTAGIQQISWTVDGVNHLSEQSFAINIGGAPTSTWLQDINAFFVSDTNTNRDFRDDTLVAMYDFGGLDIETRYTLRGGMPLSGASDITETIVITNTTNAAISFSFFQFVNLDLNGTVLDSTVEILGGQTAFQADIDPGVTVSETVVAPTPTTFQADFAADVAAAIAAGALTGQVSEVNGDLGWGFQWDFTLGAGQSVTIGKDKQINVDFLVPTPGVAGLFGVAGLAATRRRRG